MANKLIFLLLLVGQCLFCTAQSINYFKTYGGNGYDFGQGIVQLSDSGYAVTGSSSSFFDGPSQAFLLRVDSAGNYLWSANYGGNNSDWGRRVFYTPTQGYWIAGYSNSFSADANFDFYLIKTDTLGNMQWQKTYGTNDLEQLWDAVMLSDSGFLMVGQKLGDSSLNEDIYMVRTNFLGDTVWTKTIQTPATDIAYTCYLLNDTTVIVGGQSGNAADSLSAFVCSVHTNGNVNWANHYGIIGGGVVHDMDTVNNVLFCVGSCVKNDSIYKDTWKFQLDFSGNFLNENFDNRSHDDYISHVINRNGMLYYTYLSESPELNVFAGGYDLFILNVSPFYAWGGLSLPYSGLGQDECGELIRTSDGGYILVGYASDPNFVLGGNDITLIKIGASNEAPSAVQSGNHLVSIVENSIETKDLKVYPNPVFDKLTVEAPSSSMSYRLYSLCGDLLQAAPLVDKIDFVNYQSGIYILQIIQNNAVTSLKIIKE
jgi:hypothetical protein